MNHSIDPDAVQDATAEAARKRRQEILRLKDAEKLNMTELADRLGISRQRAHILVKRAQKDARRKIA